VLAEGRSGFGALTAGVMEELRDTYGSRPLLLYDVNPPEATPGEGEEPENSDPEAQAQAAARRRQRKQVSTSLATATLTEHANFYVPLNRHRLSPALGPHVSFRCYLPPSCFSAPNPCRRQACSPPLRNTQPRNLHTTCGGSVNEPTAALRFGYPSALLQGCAPARQYPASHACPPLPEHAIACVARTCALAHGVV